MADERPPHESAGRPPDGRQSARTDGTQSDRAGFELAYEVQLNKLHVIVIMISMPSVYVFGLIFKFFSWFWILGFVSLLLSPNRLSLTDRMLTIYNSPTRFFRRDRVDLTRIVAVEEHETAVMDIMRSLGNRKKRFLFYNGKKSFLMRRDDGTEHIVSSKTSDKWVKMIRERIRDRGRKTE